MHIDVFTGKYAIYGKCNFSSLYMVPNKFIIKNRKWNIP